MINTCTSDNLLTKDRTKNVENEKKHFGTLTLLCTGLIMLPRDAAVKPHKKKFSLSSPPASKFPAAPDFFLFFIYLIPNGNKLYGFVSIVVMSYKLKKKHDLPGVWG